MTSGNPGEPTVPISIACDTDPDREALLGPLPTDTLSWRGKREGIPAIKQAVADLRDAFGAPPRFTWLIRADEQIRHYYGDYGWSYTTHRAFFDGLQASGDELGWHPHFWRLDTATGRWHQEARDEPWQLAMLEAAHVGLVRAGVTPRSVRMGWAFHTAATMAKLDALGIQLDCSDISGLRTYTGTPPTHSENLYDWFDAPAHTYHPSRTQHRRVGQGADALSLLELPNFVMKSRFWGLAAGVQLARKTFTVRPLLDGLRRPRFIVNITVRPSLFAPMAAAVANAVRRAQRTGSPPPAFSTQLHPDELVPNHSRLYAPEHVAANLQALLRALDAVGARPAFVTASEFVARFGRHTFATA